MVALCVLCSVGIYVTPLLVGETERMDGWVGGWMDGWMDGWMNEKGVAVVVVVSFC